MKRHSRSIYGCTQAPEEFVCPKNCALTFNPERKRLYVHVQAWPYKHLYLDGRPYIDRVEYAQLLNDASEIRLGLNASQASQVGVPSNMLALNLPVQKPTVTVPVIELFLK